MQPTVSSLTWDLPPSPWVFLPGPEHSRVTGSFGGVTGTQKRLPKPASQFLPPLTDALLSPYCVPWYKHWGFSREHNCQSLDLYGTNFPKERQTISRGKEHGQPGGTKGLGS